MFFCPLPSVCLPHKMIVIVSLASIPIILIWFSSNPQGDFELMIINLGIRSSYSANSKSLRLQICFYRFAHIIHIVPFCRNTPTCPTKLLIIWRTNLTCSFQFCQAVCALLSRNARQRSGKRMIPGFGKTLQGITFNCISTEMRLPPAACFTPYQRTIP